MKGTTLRLSAAGYQGPGSVHTAGLRRLTSLLSGEEDGHMIDIDLQEDVTAHGATARSLFDGIASGAFDLGYMASGYLTAQVPELAVLDLPFSVADRHAAYAALDGEAGHRLSAAVASRTGLEVLAFWDNGFRHLSNRLRPLRHPRDCAGLVVRTLDNRIYQETMAAIGLEPLVTDVRELRAAVAEGRVDAQENPLTNTLNFELHRHHRHVSMTGHFFGLVLLVGNAARLAALPGSVRARIQDAAAAATFEQRRLAQAEDSAALERLRGDGVAVLEPADIDLPAFRAAVAPVAERVRESLDPGLVAAYCGPE